MQCPNCKSYDTSKNNGTTTSVGCFVMFVGFFFGGGGAGASSFYGGEMGSFLWGIYILLFGILVWIIGKIRDSKKQVIEYECKSCKYNFIK